MIHADIKQAANSHLIEPGSSIPELICNTLLLLKKKILFSLKLFIILLIIYKVWYKIRTSYSKNSAAGIFGFVGLVLLGITSADQQSGEFHLFLHLDQGCIGLQPAKK